MENILPFLPVCGIAIILAIAAFLLKKAVGTILAVIVLLVVLVILAYSGGLSYSSPFSSASCTNSFAIDENVVYSHTNGTSTRLRTAPNLDSKYTGIAEGTTATVINGPVCADGLTWWQLDVKGQTGWTAEFAPETGRLLQKK